MVLLDSRLNPRACTQKEVTMSAIPTPPADYPGTPEQWRTEIRALVATTALRPAMAAPFRCMVRVFTTSTAVVLAATGKPLPAEPTP